MPFSNYKYTYTPFSTSTPPNGDFFLAVDIESSSPVEAVQFHVSLRNMRCEGFLRVLCVLLGLYLFKQPNHTIESRACPIICPFELVGMMLMRLSQ